MKCEHGQKQTAQLMSAEGKRLFEQEDYDGAIEAFTQAIQLNPRDAENYHWCGVCYFFMGDDDRAAQHF